MLKFYFHMRFQCPRTKISISANIWRWPPGKSQLARSAICYLHVHRFLQHKHRVIPHISAGVEAILHAEDPFLPFARGAPIGEGSTVSRSWSSPNSRCILSSGAHYPAEVHTTSRTLSAQTDGKGRGLMV